MTQDKQPPSSPPVPPANLPKGGGAIRSLNDSVAVNAFTGSFSYHIPVELPVARSLMPAFSLDYDSGSGNGVLGCGVTMTRSSVSRLTRLGIPHFDATDIFTLDGAELVPRQGHDGVYLERLQAKFPFIKMLQEGTDSCYWEAVSVDNMISRYGTTPESRVFDPTNSAKIFEWLLTEVTDSKGNKIVYSYDKFAGTNSYLTSIRYGNYQDQAGAELFAFEVVIDYGNHDLGNLRQPHADPYTPAGPPPLRRDPLRSFRSAFNIATEYLCRNVLIFHRFEELGVAPCLTKFTRFEYNENPVMSTLSSLQETGCIRKGDQSYSLLSIPKTTFAFTAFNPEANPVYDQLTATDASLQSSLDLLDLEGEGITGLVSRQADSFIYFSPLGDGQFAREDNPAAIPAGFTAGQSHMFFAGVAGDGSLQLVSDSNSQRGFYTPLNYGKWKPYQPFPSSWITDRPLYLEMADISGTGRFDKVYLEPDQKIYVPSEGYEGYGKAVVLNDAKGDKEVFPYPGAVDDINPYAIHSFADMFGDGLSHRVKISSGEVCIWPTLGYGKFAEPVVIKATAPVFDATIDLRSRLLLADVDGSGTTDIIVVYPDYVEIYLNQAGNSFSAPLRVSLPESWSNADDVEFVDVTGHGTMCLLFTKTGLTLRRYFYELSDRSNKGHKAYLLSRIDNNIGASLSINYESSVVDYLRDKKSGNPWYTRLPFPIQVVRQTVTEDSISDNRLIAQYSYRNGYFDPYERMFTGFGYAEYCDLAKDLSPGAGDPPATITKKWFHTGNGLNDQLTRGEFFKGDHHAPEIPFESYDFDFGKASPATQHQALFALSGKELHWETFEEGANAPYSVASSGYYVKNPQQCSAQQYGVFGVAENQNIVLDYEQDPTDPSLTQSVVLKTDAYNFVLLSSTIYYPRRTPLLPEQAVFYATVEETIVKSQESDTARWIDVIITERSYELTGLSLNPGSNYIGFDALEAAITTALVEPIAYSEKPPLAKICARLIGWKNERYWNAGQSGVLDPEDPFPQVVLPHHSESIEFDDTIVHDAFNSDGKRLADEFIRLKGFVFREGYWWNRSVITHFETTGKFYVLKKVSNDWAKDSALDPSLYTENNLQYDNYDLFVTQTSQRLDDTHAQAEKTQMDYRVLQAKRVIDMNANIAEVLFDELGRVIASTSFGIEDGNPAGFQPLQNYRILEPAKLVDVLLDPATYLQRVENFYYYSFFENKPDGSWHPSVQLELTATEFQSQDPGTIQRAISYIDGFGRTIETRQWAGKVKLPDGLETDDGYLVSGRVIYNAKGYVGRSWLPSYSGDYAYRPDWAREIAPALPGPTTYTYDGLNRVIRTDTPKGFFTKTIYGTWEERYFDEDDTVIESSYYQEFMGSHSEGDEYDALKQAARFYNTPSVSLYDGMARTVISTKDNLGRVSPDLFDKIATPGISKQAIYDDLVQNKYLKEASQPGSAWISSKFTPYVKGFRLQLNSPVAPLASAIQKILDAHCLCTWQQYDISGRVMRIADPRFFREILAGTGDLCNIVNLFGISGKSAFLTLSLDAHSGRLFRDMLNNPVSSWNGLDIAATTTYDGLQRPLTVTLKTPVSVMPQVSQVTRRFEYGDSASDAPAKQLIGKIHKIYDSGGTIEFPDYTYTGLPKQQLRRFRTGYTTEANWDLPAGEPLESQAYSSSFRYDALGRLRQAVEPDKTVLETVYGPLGNCIQSSYRLKGAGASQPIVAHSTVTPSLQPGRVQYASGVKTFFEYDAATLDLKEIKSSRGAGADCFQQLAYTHDPAGLVTTVRNLQEPTMFHANREVNPCTQYSYDAIYRLTGAAGRQLRSAANNRQRSPGDLQQVEPYSELYAYDDGDNMTQLRHISSLNPFTAKMEISKTSNRLDKYNETVLLYDGNGQMENLPWGAMLEWNVFGNISKATIIQRDEGASDAEYYVYDYSGKRIRKIHEARSEGDNYLVDDKRYLNSLTVSLAGIRNPSGALRIETEFRSISCAGFSANDCLVQYWETNPKKNTGEVGLRYQHADLIQSVTIETNASAEIISFEEYSPFGQTTYFWETVNLEIGRKEYRYSRQEKDDNTGLYDYGFRYYLPEICRWTRPDPAGAADGLNLYAFVGNNPVGNSDHMGLGKKSETKQGGKGPKKAKDIAKVTKKAGKAKGGGVPVKRGARQKDLLGKKKGRQTHYRVKPVTRAEKKNFVTRTRQVNAILKVDGEEVITGHNSALGPNLDVPITIGTHNQHGCKCNFHAEDLTLGGFMYHVNTTYGGSLKNYHEANPHDFKHNADGVHVYSLKISASPCSGCVETIVNFKYELEKQLGDNFIFRVKFARLYDLPSTATNPESEKAVVFREGIERLRDEDIPVRLQTQESLADMMDIDEDSVTAYRPDIEGTLEMYEGVESIDMLQWTWGEQQVSRKTSNWSF
ncbi:MAG: hypothetical protein JST87_04700 [Bacteroidetes bacterium]|nr:hypothetical protein [Bacteroidota bacterium]